MPNRAPSLWTLGGLSIPDLLRRTAIASWHDDVFGQAGRMAFYQFLALFPSLLICFAVALRLPHIGAHLQSTLQDISNQIFPQRLSQLVQGILNDFNVRSHMGLRLLTVLAGAIWASHNGTWSIIWGMNRAYEVEEHRDWRQLTLIVAGITLCLAVATFMAIVLVLLSASLQKDHHFSTWVLRTLEWIIMLTTLSFSFAIVYRFAPDLPNHRWRWSTPGALCALILWTISTFGARLYFNHTHSYGISYGHLNGVVMLLLWLYLCNGAVLIGAEMNSEIQKAETGHPHTQTNRPKPLAQRHPKQADRTGV